MGEVRDAMSEVIDRRSLRQLSDDTWRLASTAEQPGIAVGESRA